MNPSFREHPLRPSPISNQTSFLKETDLHFNLTCNKERPWKGPSPVNCGIKILLDSIIAHTATIDSLPLITNFNPTLVMPHSGEPSKVPSLSLTKQQFLTKLMRQEPDINVKSHNISDVTVRIASLIQEWCLKMGLHQLF